MICLILRQYPGCRFIDIFIAALEHREDLGDGVRHVECLHPVLHLRRRTGHDLLQVIIDRRCDVTILHHAAEILVAHGNGAVHQISQRIREVRIVSLNHQIPADHAVVLKRHLMQDEIPHGVHAEQVHEIVRIDHVALGFAHLAVRLQQPRVSEYLLRQRKPH